MKKIKIVLNIILQHLSKNKFNVGLTSDYQIITFFDKRYPNSLIQYIYSLPIIYYYGDGLLLNRINGIVITHSPSYYAQKIITEIRLVKPVICLKSSANSITNQTSLCDIIYSNDISELGKSNVLLSFSFNQPFNHDQLLQLFSVLMGTVYVIEGYTNRSSFEFISNCIDNQVIIKAVPTNIYFSGSKLPNRLLEQGIAPLLLN